MHLAISVAGGAAADGDLHRDTAASGRQGDPVGEDGPRSHLCHPVLFRRRGVPSFRRFLTTHSAISHYQFGDLNHDPFGDVRIAGVDGYAA